VASQPVEAPVGRRSPPRGRRTQAERSATTRALLLDATIDCLVEAGYAGTSTTLIAARARVSRGAQLHHFPSKAALVARAVERLAQRRLAELRRQATRLPSRRGRPRAALDLLWSTQSGPLFEAALELWVAARTDPELRETLIPVEERVSASTLDVCRDLFGTQTVSRRDFGRLVTMSLNTMQGLALLRARRESREVERMWTFTRDWLVCLFEGPGA
jgi:AcrR family transcriptional regulator